MYRKELQHWFDRGSPHPVPGSAATRIWRMGDGPAVVCLHGVPTAAYLYRKVLPELASRGLEGVAMDFPGLGFAERPADFDYSWTGLSAWLEQAIDAAGINNFHLLVHDLGGPVGLDLVRRIPQRIQSLTVLNTLVNASRFEKPWVMRPFEVPLLGRLWTWQMATPAIVPFFRWKGVLGRPTAAELRAYGDMLLLGDGGRAFQKIMSSFENTRAFEDRILPGLADRSFPAQVIWGRYDTELTVREHGADALAALGLEKPIHLVEGKHFLQEDCPEEIAERVAMLVSTAQDL